MSSLTDIGNDRVGGQPDEKQFKYKREKCLVKLCYYLL